MLKDTLEVTINTAKLMLLGFSIYAVAMMTKPAELELRTGQLRQWWTGLRNGQQEQVSQPSADDGTKETWDF